MRILASTPNCSPGRCTAPRAACRSGARGASAILFGTLWLGLLSTGCTRNPEGGTPSSEPAPRATVESPASIEAQEPLQLQDEAGGISWHAEAPLLGRRPSSAMRAAEYAVRGHPDAELTVFHFPRDEGGGGQVQANIDRWVDQFEQPDGRPSREVARIEQTRANDVPITLIDVGGRYVGMRGMAAGPPRDGWRMLGAIAEGPSGMVFFKLTGPSAAIEESEGAFRALVESIQPAR